MGSINAMKEYQRSFHMTATGSSTGIVFIVYNLGWWNNVHGRHKSLPLTLFQDNWPRSLSVHCSLMAGDGANASSLVFTETILSDSLAKRTHDHPRLPHCRTRNSDPGHCQQQRPFHWRTLRPRSWSVDRLLRRPGVYH